MGAEIMEVIFEWNKNKTCLQQQYKQNLSTQPCALLISKRERERKRGKTSALLVNFELYKQEFNH